jgi:hypothetical protein
MRERRRDRPEWYVCANHDPTYLPCVKLGTVRILYYLPYV